MTPQPLLIHATQRIIGVGYHAGSGKDTVGEYLVRNHGFTRIAFADKLKEIVGLLYNRDASRKEFKDELLPNGLRGGATLQAFAMHMRAFDPACLIHATGLQGWGQIAGARIVVTDVRFKNEADIIEQLGGETWHIHRRFATQDTHVSETQGAEIKWTRTINNHHSLQFLYSEVEEALKAYHERVAESARVAAGNLQELLGLRPRG